jgi:hypothetical protein
MMGVLRLLVYLTSLAPKPQLKPQLQAIDKLEKLLNGELNCGSMFGPREYVAIYT